MNTNGVAVTPLREPAHDRPPPPANTEAEQCLLGAMLVNNTAYTRVAEFLLPEHFANALHGRIYAAIGALVDRGIEANPITLRAQFEHEGGARYLAELAAAAITIVNAEHYGRTIHDLYLRRKLIALAEDLIADAGHHDFSRSAVAIAQEHAARLDSVHARSGVVGVGIEEWDAGDDDQPIPPRGWLLGNVLCRRFVSSLIADGGVGKTAVRVAQCLSLATGRALTGEHVFQRCRVLLVSLEDDRDELRRRVDAAIRHYRVSRPELKGWLFLSTPGLGGGKLATTENGEHTRSVLAAQLVATIKRRAPDVVCLDPFVKSHGVEENANNAIDFVAGILAKIAIEYDCAIDAPHHVSKGAPDAGNANRGRGASSFKDAARLVYTLTPMSEADATLFGVSSDERPFLIRMDSAKVNIAPPARSAKWFKLIGVRLDNGSGLYSNGDEVQTVEPWEPPDAWDGVTEDVARLIMAEIDAGLPDGRLYTNETNATDRAAAIVVRKHLPGRTDKQAREIIRTWIESDALRSADYDDPVQRKPRKGLRLNPANQPGAHAWGSAA